MKLQGDAAKGFAASPKAGISAALVFGDDEGLNGDIAGEIIANWRRDQDAELVQLDDDEIRKSPASLIEALESRSLLQDARVLLIKTKGEKISRHIIDALDFAANISPDQRPKLVVIAGALAKRSKLRAAFETGQATAALHLFAETQADLLQFVGELLKGYGQTIDEDALSLFCENLPPHRALVRSEAEKLALYAEGLDRPIGRADIRAISLSASDDSVRQLAETALAGNVEQTRRDYDRLSETGLNAITLVRALEFESRRLLQAYQYDPSRADTGRKLKPPVWPSDWQAFSARLSNWSPARLVSLLQRLRDQEFDAKLSAGLADPAMRKFVMDIAAAGAQSRPARVSQ